jgi:hypothetical protein
VESKTLFHGRNKKAVAGQAQLPVSLQLALSPMMLFPIRIEHALDVTVQRPHDADARPILIANARAQPPQAAPVLNQIAHQPSRLAE